MNAVISGTKGFALLVDGEAVDLIHLDGRRGSTHATHVRRMLDEPGDTCFVECHDLAEVQRRLQEAADAADALQLTLIALDVELSSDTRREACGELADLYEVASTVESVERVLYARPLGLEHDLHGARGLASSRAVRGFFDRLDAVQSASARVEAAWEQIPEAMFVEASRPETFARFVKLGLVRDFVAIVAIVDIVESVAARDTSSHALLLASNPRVRELDGDRSLLAQWLVLAQGLEQVAAPYDYRSEEAMAAQDEGRGYTVEVAPGTQLGRRTPK